MIVSGDKDFIQLQKHSFVTQYSPTLKKFVNGIDPHVYIKEHILKGDRSDGVPNFLSPDDYIRGRNASTSDFKKETRNVD